MKIKACIAAAGLLAASLSGGAAQTGVSTSFFLRVGSDSVRVTHHAPTTSLTTGPPLVLIPGWPAIAEDVLELGLRLRQEGVHVYVLNPRGHGRSSGFATFANALEDVDVLLRYLRSDSVAPQAGHRPSPILGGYSWGGGIALAYAAQHPEVRRVISIAGSDHGVFINRVDNDPEYGSFYRRALESTQAPEGPVNFDVERDLEELRSDWDQHDLATIAPRLVDRDILIIAGWDDQQVELEWQVLPFYRSLRQAGGQTVRIVGFQDDHSFRDHRMELAIAVRSWMSGG